MSIEGFELCEAIISAGYGASSFKIQKMQEDKRSRRLAHKGFETERRYVRNYQKLIAKLKMQGLVLAEDKDGKDIIAITPKGRSKLSALEASMKRRLPAVSYKAHRSEHPVIVSFDIPEKQKRKREWLREVLKQLGLKMVHRSVWIGTVKMPRQFLDDLHELNLIDCIEIFEVGKSGTLRHVIQHS